MKATLTADGICQAQDFGGERARFSVTALKCSSGVLPPENVWKTYMRIGAIYGICCKNSINFFLFLSFFFSFFFHFSLVLCLFLLFFYSFFLFFWRGGGGPQTPWLPTGICVRLFETIRSIFACCRFDSPQLAGDSFEQDGDAQPVSCRTSSCPFVGIRGGRLSPQRYT